MNYIDNPYIRYNPKTKAIIFHFKYNKDIIAAIKEIRYRKYDDKNKEWSCKLSLDNFKTIHNIITIYKFTYSEELIRDLKKLVEDKSKKLVLYDNNVLSSSAIKPTKEIKLPNIKLPLYDFQLAGVEYIINNKKVLVADEMGLGKTIEAIASIDYMNQYPCLVICLNSLKYNWLEEYNKWLLNPKKIKLVNNEDTTIDLSNDIIIMSYNTLIQNVDDLNNFGFKSLIVDESHCIKNNHALRTTAVQTISKNIDTILLLSGTPILNKPAELITQLKILDIFKNICDNDWKFFVERYCNGKNTQFGWDIKGSSNTIELHHKLRKYGYLRRNKRDVLHELPDKVRIPLKVNLSNLKEYKKAEKNIYKYILNQFYNTVKELTKGFSEADKNEYILNHKEQIIQKIMSAETLIKMSSLRQLAGHGKIDSIIEWSEQVLEQEDKLIIFAIHKEVIAKLQQKFNCNIITGDIEPKLRQEYINDFQNNPDTHVLILNIATGNAGYTLTKTNTVAFAELDWSPGNHLQSEDRAHRIGQHNVVNCYYFIGKNTIDEKLFDNYIIKKLIILSAVNSGIVIDENDIYDDKINFKSIINDIISEKINIE